MMNNKILALCALTAIGGNIHISAQRDHRLDRDVVSVVNDRDVLVNSLQ